MKSVLVRGDSVLVRGDGVAAYCCVHTLQQAGIRVMWERPNRRRVPAIMLSETAVALLADVFGRPELFREMPRIPRRTVLWGPDSEAVTLPHSGVVVSEEELLAGLYPSGFSAAADGRPEWRVFASAPLPPEALEQRFGSRMAQATPVELQSAERGCWTESTEDGWLFLMAGANGWLLSAGAAVEALLGQSRLIAPLIRGLDPSSGQFPAHPRIACPLAAKTSDGELWLACGTAALGFDPLCGDGTAHAVREAILAAAVIRAVAEGADAGQVLAHYESRLTAGFQRHLQQCVSFYRTGRQSAWWRAELDALERGISWCSERLSQFPAFRYRLNGYALEAIA